MEIEFVHDFIYEKEEDYLKIQKTLSKQINLKRDFNIEKIKYVAGVDISYWKRNEEQFGVCVIVIVDYVTKKILRKIHSYGKINMPYISGFLAFKELPLFIKTARKLSYEPDIFIFDGNGYLHPNHMGLATHASFFLKKPTIGVAKSFFRFENSFYDMPENEMFAYTDIVLNGEVYGRAIRTKKDVKPIFVSPGNYIDIDTSMDIIVNLVGKESRVPIPTRIADIESNIIRKKIQKYEKYID